MTPTRAHLTAVAAAALVAVAAAGCGKATSETASTQPSASVVLNPDTPAATRDIPRATWATYRDVTTLDPVQAFDQPEYLADGALCESVLRQQPDGSIAPGLAERYAYRDPRTLVLTIRRGVTFWDGKPLTPADVVFSLKRSADPGSGSFYAGAFARVKSIAATGGDEVTITLRQPDYALVGELSATAGTVLQQAFVEQKGKTFGTPQGGTMCTGAFKLKSWKAGSGVTTERYDGYWGERAKTGELTFKGVPDDASLTAGLLSGDVDGVYSTGLTTFDQLKASPEVTVTEGPAYQTDAIVVADLRGVLGDVRVRRALSLALDRQAYVDSLYHGAALLPRSLANPGTWGYARPVFQADWDALPQPAQDVPRARALIAQARAAGKTVTLAMTTEIPLINSAATVVREAGAQIGLNVKFKAVSAQAYTGLFTDPAARRGIDAFPTGNGPYYADPASFYSTFALPDGIQNFSGFSDPQITEELERARATGDATARAKLVVAVGDRLMRLLPWIPLAAPSTVLVTASDLTGAPASQSGSLWANGLGGR